VLLTDWERGAAIMQNLWKRMGF